MTKHSFCRLPGFSAFPSLALTHEVTQIKPITVGLLGLGTVGSGTIEVLRRNREEISRRAGRDIVIKAASARDLKKQRPVSLEGIELVPTAGMIVERPDIDPERDLRAIISGYNESVGEIGRAHV